jgi:4-carboxymuconolactone decarboxylase
VVRPPTDADGALPGPFGGFLLAPAIGEALQGLGAAIRYRDHRSARARELAILTVAAHHDSRFERYAHEAVGATLGLSETEMAAVRDGTIPGADRPRGDCRPGGGRGPSGGDVDDAT